jgi:peptidoglycan-associated lipoprotein
MKLPMTFFIIILAIATGMVGMIPGCSKKITQVATLPVEEPKPEPIPEPVAPPPVDSSAILADLMRSALQNIYFDFDTYVLRPAAIERLSIIGKLLLEHEKITIVIEGHCDERGSSDYNMALGEQRAQAAKRWLVGYGIAESRIQTTSYGKERLAALGCSDDPCHERNRRCEFVATIN